MDQYTARQIRRIEAKLDVLLSGMVAALIIWVTEFFGHDFVHRYHWVHEIAYGLALIIALLFAFWLRRSIEQEIDGPS